MRRLAAILSLTLLAGLFAAQAATAESQPVDAGILCVGNPPRQTFDPLSPPCVPFWDGDNGGATAPGVTGDEIRVLVVLEGGVNYTGGSDPTNRTSPSGVVYDLGRSEDECRIDHGNPYGCSHLTVRGLRVWQQYFNDRFQTYGRFAHVYAAFTESRNRDQLAVEAAWHLDEVDPFAVIPLLREGFDAYTDVVRSRNRLVFADHGLLSEATLDDDLLWDFRASIDVHATNFGALACREVVNRPPARVSISTRSAVNAPFEALGDPPEDRRVGLLSTFSPDAPNLIVAADVVRSAMAACGGDVVAEAFNPHCCFARDNGARSSAAAEAMVDFRNAGVTTIVWAGGFNNEYPEAATAMGYQPEWILLGDELLGNSSADFWGTTGPQFHDRAVVLESQLPVPDDRPGGETCDVAFREIDQDTPDVEAPYVCDYYQALFLGFVGFQVAGPTLTNDAVADGFGAIPVFRESGFGEGHSLLRGGHLSRYDATMQKRGSATPGCWRIASGRQGPADWPDADVFGWAPGACDLRSSSVRLNAA